MEDFEVKLTKAEYEQLSQLNDAAIEHFDEGGEANSRLQKYAAFLFAGAGHTIEAGQSWSFSKLKGGRYVLTAASTQAASAGLPF